VGDRARGAGAARGLVKTNDVSIKRVVGLPGDVLAMVNGHVIRNGKREADAYAQSCSGACTFPKPITVPAGDYYVLGDNRGASADSRLYGPIPRAWIIGTLK
jgi:signal peptidase I